MEVSHFVYRGVPVEKLALRRIGESRFEVRAKSPRAFAVQITRRYGGVEVEVSPIIGVGGNG